VLDQDEITLIRKMGPKLWEQCGDKLTRNSLATMYAYIGFENSEYSQNLMSNIFMTMPECTWEGLKSFERILLRQFQIQDGYQQERIKLGLNKLYEALRNNTMFYKYEDSLIEMICKFVTRVPMMVDMLGKQQNNPFLRHIEQWTKENLHFPVNQSRMKIFKKGLVSFKPNSIN